MRALTVQQPWAWAIVHGGKDVENRTRNLAGSYRGPVAIHAGLREDLAALNDEVLWEAMRPYRHAYPEADPIPIDTLGAFLGVVDLVDVHLEQQCLGEAGAMCSPWGQTACRGSHGSGADCPATTNPLVHLALEHPRPLEVPIPARGRLGLWTPDSVLLDRIREQVPA